MDAAKKTTVSSIQALIKDYPVVALLDMENIPADTMQEMRNKLRSHAKIIMTKKRLMKLAFQGSEDSKKGISELSGHFRGMPALLFTKENPFKIASLLRKSRTPAFAKAGQIAPFDIVIPKGPTAFSPGPIISELGSIGIKSGVEGGKVAVKEKTTVAKAGEPIKPKVADVLGRLEIKPMEVGLTMTAAYEDGVLYPQGVLEVDATHYTDMLLRAAAESFAVALGANIVNSTTIPHMIRKAARDAFLVAISKDIMVPETIKHVLAKAHRQASSVEARFK